MIRFDPENVHAAWQKSLDRRVNDPEGAITAARTLLETVCKHVLDDTGNSYDHKADLPKLWKLCADELNLSPSQHSEEVFKTILGNCQSIVNSLGAVREAGSATPHGRAAALSGQSRAMPSWPSTSPELWPPFLLRHGRTVRILVRRTAKSAHG